MLVAKLLPHIVLASFFLLLSCYSSATTASVTQQQHLIELQISAGEWPPFLSAELPHQGVVAHLIHDIFLEAGYQVSFTFLPWGRAYRDTAHGKYDATAIWMFSHDRTPDFIYSEPVLDEKFVFFHQIERKFTWQQLQDLRGLVIGGGVGYSYGPDFDNALKSGLFQVSRAVTTEDNFRLLAAGRIDVFAEEISVGYYTLRQHLPEIANRITHHPKALLINQSFLMLPKSTANSTQLMALFNQHLEQFKRSGRYQTYFDQLAQGKYQ